MTSLRPTSIDEVQAAVQMAGRLLPHGARTKPALTAVADEVQWLDMRGLTGVVEYAPEEFTFTALAGTPLRDIDAMLAQRGQYLPFDPPLVREGATLGGTVAAGLSGSGQKRFGGVRDFAIGVRLVDGTGQLIRGGGKVVKNAAGFDLPKLMVGSQGRLGAIVELTFKVFPLPEAWRTVRINCRNLHDALAVMAALNRQPLELDALDLHPPATLVARVAGNAASIDAHARRVAAIADRPCEMPSVDDADGWWQAQRSLKWLPPSHRLIKLATTPRQVPVIEASLSSPDSPRCYAVAGNVLWLAWPETEPWPGVREVGVGLTLLGSSHPGDAAPPPDPAAVFAQRIKHALDPQQRFPDLRPTHAP